MKRAPQRFGVDETGINRQYEPKVAAQNYEGPMTWKIWLFAAWCAVVGAAQAQEVPRGIFVEGEGRVSTAPDMAVITLGVRQRAETADAAMGAIASAVADMLAAIEAQGIAKADQQTSRFYLNPVYADLRTDNQRQIIGYEAGNAVTVTVRDLDRLGAVLDAVVATGANDFNGLSFGLQDNSTALEAARRAAVADAMARAGVLAEAAGLTLGPVLQITDGARASGPMPMAMADARVSMESAIAPGEVDVTARVTMVFGIAGAE